MNVNHESILTLLSIKRLMKLLHNSEQKCFECPKTTTILEDSQLLAMNVDYVKLQTQILVSFMKVLVIKKQIYI